MHLSPKKDMFFAPSQRQETGVGGINGNPPHRIPIAIRFPTADFLSE